MRTVSTLIITLTILFASPLLGLLSAQQSLSEETIPIPAQIEKEWKDRLAYLRDGDRVNAAATVEKIKKIKLELGADNLDLISVALLIEAEEDVAKGNVDSAIEKAYAAREISPDYPATYYHIAKFLFLKDKSIIAAVSSYIDGIIVSCKDFWNIFYLAGTIVIILLLSLISSFVIFLIFLLIRFIPLIEHNLNEWAGISLKRYSIIMIIIAISSLPLLLGRGIIWSAVFWLMLVWIYLGKREKTISILFLLVAGSATLLLPLSGSFFSAGGSSGLEVMNRIYRGEWISPSGRYGEITNEEREDWKGYFSAAISMKMQGRLDDALRYYEEALTKNPGSPKILNNIGNIYFYKTDYEQAIYFYRSAIEIDKQLISSHYNMSQALREKLSFDEGNKKFGEASGLDKELTDLYAKKSTLSYQYLVIDEKFSIFDLFEKAISFKGLNEDHVLLNISLFAIGIHQPFFQVLLVILIILMVLFSSHLRKKGNLPTNCPVCGRAVCRKCHRYIYDIKVCNNCLSMLKKRQEDKKTIKGIKDIKEIWTREKLKERMSNILAALIPGLGHLHMDRFVKGFII
ncbi:MAG: tetratricopeptide repeat protein, partial [Nitrospirota bacterium]